jgi:arylsulfatase
VLDDTGFGQFGSYGVPIETPNLDALAENRFLSEMLRQHGYNTYAIGKWHLIPAEQISADETRYDIGAKGATIEECL